MGATTVGILPGIQEGGGGVEPLLRCRSTRQGEEGVGERCAGREIVDARDVCGRREKLSNT